MGMRIDFPLPSSSLDSFPISYAHYIPPPPAFVLLRPYRTSSSIGREVRGVLIEIIDAREAKKTKATI